MTLQFVCAIVQLSKPIEAHGASRRTLCGMDFSQMQWKQVIEQRFREIGRRRGMSEG